MVKYLFYVTMITKNRHIINGVPPDTKIHGQFIAKDKEEAIKKANKYAVPYGGLKKITAISLAKDNLGKAWKFDDDAE